MKIFYYNNRINIDIIDDNKSCFELVNKVFDDLIKDAFNAIEEIRVESIDSYFIIFNIDNAAIVLRHHDQLGLTVSADIADKEVVIKIGEHLEKNFDKILAWLGIKP